MGDSGFEEIATLGNVTTYTDLDVKEGKKYSYWVVALSDIGDGEATIEANVKIKKADEEPGFGGGLVLLTMCILALILVMRRIR
jgi:hypothetical protein